MSLIKEIYRGEDDTPIRVEFEADYEAWEITYCTALLSSGEIDELLDWGYCTEGYGEEEHCPDR